MKYFGRKQKQETTKRSLYENDPFLECYAIVKGKMANKMPLNDVEQVMAECIGRFYGAIHPTENKVC